MKIAGIQPFSLSDFPGVCACIIFTAGCNFRCSYCHNKQFWKDNCSLLNDQEVFDLLIRRQNQLDGVVITGGEPTIHTDLKTFITRIKNLGYKIKLDTNGSNPKIIKDLITENLLDYIAMDIKAPFSLYDKLCAVKTYSADIKQSMDIIAASNIAHEFRTTWDKTNLTSTNLEEIKLLIPQNSKLVIQECKYPNA